jgi:hypothetical protein
MTMLQLTRNTLSSSVWPKNLLLKWKTHTGLDPNKFWLFPKIKSDLNGLRSQDTEKIKIKKNDDRSTTGISKMFPTVATSLG